jgi:hypothetical protein
MRDIPSDDAKTNYGITARHQEMDNGELRFRLVKSDGTAYIRTEASSAGAWQNSHYHQFVRETYIVQRGWIAYAELLDGKRKLTLYNAGEVFTTKPDVVHNVYMPANAAIHTVKHGDATNEDRLVNETTKQFDRDTRDLNEEQLKGEAAKPTPNKPSEIPVEKYTVEYRHFDTLIWQLPAWSTALFLVTAVGTNSVQSAQFLHRPTGLSVEQLATGFLGLMFLVIMTLSQALYRFRRHQGTLRRYPRTPVLSSASTYLQLVVTTEAFVLLFVVLMLNDVPTRYATYVCAALVVAFSAYREIALRRPYISDQAI